MTSVQSQRLVMVRPGISALSQETLAILGVGVALAALILTSFVGLRVEIHAVRDEARAERQAIRVEARAERQAIRDEGRADREAIRAEARAEREAIRGEARADREAIRAEARAHRDALRAAHETFQNQILRLTEQQGILRARLDGISGPSAPVR